MKHFNRIQFVGLMAFSLAVACGGSGDDTSGGDGDTSGDGDAGVAGPLEIVSWWKNPGEAEALDALLGVHGDRNPDSEVTNSATASGADSEAEVAKRIEAGNPADVHQENAFDIPLFLEEHPGSLVQLDDLFEENGWNDLFLPQVLEAITVDGHIYSMPVGVHRENSLFINQSIFTEYGLDAPTSIEELFAACDALQAEGIDYPLATGGQGWILRIMFHSIAMGTMGDQEYVDFFTGEGDPDDPALVSAIENFGTIIDNYVDPAVVANPESGWDLAAKSLYDGDAAMFYHGDWAGGYVQSLGWEAGVDYAAVSAPGAEGLFLMGVDVFAMTTDAKNPESAMAFLESIGSEEGQAAFNNAKGSTTYLLEIDESLLSPVGKASRETLANAEIVMTTPSWDKVDDAILAYALDSDEAALVKFFQDAIYP